MEDSGLRFHLPPFIKISQAKPQTLNSSFNHTGGVLARHFRKPVVAQKHSDTVGAFQVAWHEGLAAEGDLAVLVKWCNFICNNLIKQINK